jgi:hypothetical protein
MEVLQWIQQNPQKCRIKEGKTKLSLTFDKVKSIDKAYQLLSEIHSNTSASKEKVTTE